MTYSSGLSVSPNVQPIFIRTPQIASVKLAAQVVGRDPGSSVPELLYTGGAGGGLIESIEVYPLGVNVKSVLRLYYTQPYKTGYFLFRETLLPAITAALADDVLTGYPIKVALPKILAPASPDPTKPNDGLRVPAGIEIRAALGVAIAAGVIVTMTGGDYN